MLSGKKILIAIAAAVLMAAAPSISSAAITVTLQSLLEDGATIQSGDKLFSDFTYVASGDMPSAAGVNVITTTVSGNFGLRFQGAFRDVAGGGSSTATITYTVTVLDPHFNISDLNLQGNPAVSVTGTMDVTEST